jgi:molybdopterin converting factor small subunit
VRRVVIHLATALRPYAGDRGQLEVSAAGGTVGAVLDALWAACPGVRDRVLTEQGALRSHVNVFVGRESIRFTDGLDTPVPEGAEISILPAVSGGRA